MREDRRGYWAKTIAEREAGGLSVPAFCRERGERLRISRGADAAILQLVLTALRP